MKISCNIKVDNRIYSGLAEAQIKNKFLKSTLALCKHPKKEESVLLLFSAQNKNGTNYRIVGNIKQVLTKYLDNGMCTIQFCEPQHNLYIQSDAIQLKVFLRLLKQAMENKLSKGYSSLSVTAIKPKEKAVTKMTITKRSDYPVKGFPRTLESLCINEIGRCSFDKGILKLTNLKTLDLSHNAIEFLPEEVNTLPNLKELKLSHNLLRKSNGSQWKWMGNLLQKSLCLLDISYNELTDLPRQIGKLHNISLLHVDHNNLTTLPSSIGNLTNLKMFFASNNNINFLPGSIKKLKLEYLDFSHNKFEQISSTDGIFPKKIPVLSLKDCAAKKVLWKKMYYGPGIIPLTLIDYLDSANYCVCGKACFDIFVKHFYHLDLFEIAHSFSSSSDSSMFVPTECYFCSMKCFAYNHSKRKRHIIIR